MMNFQALKKNLRKDFIPKKVIRLAIAGDSATQFLSTAIKGMGIEHGIAIEIYEAPYDQIDLQVQNPRSELYAFGPDCVLLMFSSQKVQGRFYKAPSGDRDGFGDTLLAEVSSYYDVLKDRLNCRVIVSNIAVSDDSVYGQYANKYPSSFLYQLRKFNFRLMELAGQCANLAILDIEQVKAETGAKGLIDQKFYIQAGIAFGLDALPLIAQRFVDILLAYNGFAKKCLILDLDNTVWGGVIGDDGINSIEIGELGIGKAYTAIQRWAKELKNRGIIICVASKNTESIARGPFEKHPEMILKMDDIAVFMANWDNKVKNIQRIQEILNIGFDSMVFVDDNPFERNMVRENLPAVYVPELPEDPSEYLSTLQSLNLFETNAISGNDAVRTEQYKQEAERTKQQQYFTNEDDFLANLEMQAVIEPLTSFNLPRIAQLTQRSNQFNLRTIRFTEDELSAFSLVPDQHVISFSLSDKYGSHGLIAIVLLKQRGSDMFIENWLMSCRVLKRGMENFTLNTVAAFAKENGCLTLTGEYLPTAKNELVKDHYKNLGFAATGNKWQLDLPDFLPHRTFISSCGADEHITEPVTQKLPV